MSLRRAFKVFQRNLSVYRKLYKSSIVLNFVEPILYLFAFGYGFGSYLGEVEGMPYPKFIAPGIIASSTMFASTYESTYGTYVRMQIQRTFDAILSTPVTVNDLIVGEMIWGAFKSVFYGSIMVFTLFFLGFLDSPTSFLIIPILFLSGIIFSEISIMVTSLVPGVDSFNYFYTLFMTPLFLFSGVFFPVTVLPHGLREIADFTPLFHVTSICRAYSQGLMPSPIHFLYLLSLSLVLFYPSMLLMRRRILD